ncbi:MAG: hypothetical protein CMM27_10245 [Rhodospirillaceae bacterium]|nr:hypothetical protein [Rhodospirillaceae bacterium]
MAETLTYDAGTDTVTTSENLTPEEQDSLKVGEEMQAQQEELLAGKYKNAKELEDAYIELQKKLGSDEPAEETTSEETKEEPEVSPQVSLITDASNEYEQNGELSPETMQKFTEMSSADLVNAYMQIQKNAPQQQTESADLTDAEVNTIKNSAGGDKAYDNLISWVSDNLPKSQVDAFDNLVESGNVQAIQLAVQGLKASYEEANGYEGRMLQGKPAKSAGDVFRSQPELVEAMADPRYDNDPAYRRDVMDKLSRSDMNF